ncbi:hypothetical protein CYMTET_38831 [Cymbomonas tetramitiformis]|uniref:Endonuclease/exonuclease/phosphatase domain-containing protein n=1 Tax=Cymbomonas tetramitiformis TaxID=36881 RepID=A0AAE0CB85_9CHLO|nr:hypothetical protein CYMTET_46562 [Cymbomonas tetramitiformis]KAK3251846.1 hypothetical protein CYMTET_38831 [Cymbomonas tetramitiformis]|eukprot:gene22604-27284_t
MVEGSLSLSSWNIAAVNNNPFEYWITHNNDGYNKLMLGVQDFIEAPGDKDLLVSEVFTADMFRELKDAMIAEGWKGIDETEAEWDANYKNRKIISGFLKDKEIGAKRLASMPDRITNTINTVNEGAVCRPTVINLYEGNLETAAGWWSQWKDFMFTKEVQIKTKAGVETKKVCQLLEKIKNSKYPAITVAEEEISIPLQTLCQAIFDAILVHIMNTESPGTWHALKMSMCEALNKKKDDSTLSILSDVYGDSDVIFLQEVAATFIDKAQKTSLGSSHHILVPEKLDGKRDQNSIILAKKATFTVETVKEVTSDIESSFDASVPVAGGDLFAVTIDDVNGKKFVLASFHGDTNGLATLPVVTAVNSFVDNLSEPHKFLFGLDANTNVEGSSKILGMNEFVSHYLQLGLTSCWGDTPDPLRIKTTYNARTYLQPQLNKAIRSDEKESKGNNNPNDFILFKKADFQPLSVLKDNTGKKEYVEGMSFPTLEFPSDHGVISTKVEPVLGKEEL